MLDLDHKEAVLITECYVLSMSVIGGVDGWADHASIVQKLVADLGAEAGTRLNEKLRAYLKEKGAI